MIISALTAAQPATAATVAQARDFETMAISQLLMPMFDTIAAPSPLFGGSEAEKTWQPFLLNAIAAQMEEDGGLGLADQITNALKEKPAL